MSKSPFIPKARSYNLLTAAVLAVVPQGDDWYSADGQQASSDAHQWVEFIDDLQAGTITLEEFTSRAGDMPWMGANFEDSVSRFIQYETQRVIWSRYQARLAREKAAHQAETTNLGDLLQGALQMARESRHAA